MDEAATAVSEGVYKGGGWRQKADAALSEAIKTLDGIEEINDQLAAAAKKRSQGPDDQKVVPVYEPGKGPYGTTPLDALRGILNDTRTSLRPAALQPAAYNFGGPPDDGKVPGVALNQDPGLIEKIRQLVRDGKYFNPGSTTQIVNCIAVCLPVWIAYRGNTPDKVSDRKRIIASAIFWGLIRGIKSDDHPDLADKLQGIYEESNGDRV
jgi:hypothetical protein